MPIPGPEERPDLYDDYDGRPGGKDDISEADVDEMIKALQGERPQVGEQAQQQGEADEAK